MSWATSLIEYAQRAACPLVEFTFNGEVKTGIFYKRPWGLTFENKLPLTVTKCASGGEVGVVAFEAHVLGICLP